MAVEILNYTELHRNSDLTDPRVQTRWYVLNLDVINRIESKGIVVRSKRSQTTSSTPSHFFENLAERDGGQVCF